MTRESKNDDPVRRGLAELKSIGRDIGGRLKDAGDDVKEAWDKLQPHLAKADEIVTAKTGEIGDEVSTAATAVIDDLKSQLKSLRNKLDGK